MGLVAGIGDKAPPRILMLAAVLLLAVSQFFAYFDVPGIAFEAAERGAEAAPGLWRGLPATGWELHPQALPILFLLLIALLARDIAEHALFRRFGYWIALALVFAAMSPGAPMRAAGAALGGIAFLMALVAAIWQQLLPRMTVPPVVEGPPPPAA